MKNKEADWAPAKRYNDMLETLLFGTGAPTRHPHSGARKEKVKLNRTKIQLTETADKPGDVASGYEDSVPDVTEVAEIVMPRGEAARDIPDIKDDLDEEFALYYVVGDEISPDMQTEEQQRRLRLRIYDGLNLRSFIFQFDVRYPNLYHISILLIKLEELWRTSSIIDQLKILLIKILFWTGNHPDDVMLMGMHADEKMPSTFDRHKLFITKSKEGRYYLIKEALIQYKKTPKGAQNCRPTSKIIKFQLPDLLTPYIDKVWGERKASGYFFSAVSPSAETTFGLDKVREYLDSHVNSKFGLSLTPHRIAYAFFPIFSARYGLDEILAYYISGQHQTLFRSRSHYLYISPMRLETNYLKVARLVKGKIEDNAKAVLKIKKKYFSADITSKCVLPQPPDDVADYLINPVDIEYGYGSAIIPVVEALRNYVTSLREKIMSKGWGAIIERHNLYVDYMYLCAMFNFALRPRNEPSFPFHGFAKRLFEVINDKLSCRFFEERLLPVTSCLRSLTEDYRRGIPRLLRRLGGRRDPSLLSLTPDNFFFFFNKKGKSRKFLLATWRQTLKKEGIPYPYNMRSPRHFLKTYFYENGVCDELSDAWHGHTHIAREPMGITSSVVYAEMVAHGLPIVETMLSEIGFLPVPYLPED